MTQDLSSFRDITAVFEDFIEPLIDLVAKFPSLLLDFLG